MLLNPRRKRSHCISAQITIHVCQGLSLCKALWKILSVHHLIHSQEAAVIFLGEKASQGEQGTLFLGIAGDRPWGGGDWGEVNVAASLWSVSPGSAPPQTPVHDLGEMAFPLWVEFPLHKMRNGQVPIPSLQGQKFWKPEVVPRPLQGQKGVKLMWDLIISLSVNMHFTEENTSVFDYSAPQSHLGSSVTFRMGSPELASHSESLTSRPQSFRSDTADFE